MLPPEIRQDECDNSSTPLITFFGMILAYSNPHIMPPTEQQSQSSAGRSFTSQTASAEELLKSQTVGLVHLSDFRKRRAEVLEQKEREAHDKSLGRVTSGNSRSATPSTSDVTDG